MLRVTPVAAATAVTRGGVLHWPDGARGCPRVRFLLPWFWRSRSLLMVPIPLSEPGKWIPSSLKPGAAHPRRPYTIASDGSDGVILTKDYVSSQGPSTQRRRNDITDTAACPPDTRDNRRSRS